MIGARQTDAVVWHDVECGAYAADLPLWAALADRADGEVLELGCGGGRVALDLARRGHAVTGLDLSGELLAALRERAAAESLEVSTQRGDAREFDLDRNFGLVIAAMQLVQLFDTEGRRSMLAATARHLAPGGSAALAITAGTPAPWRAAPGSAPPPPDVRELDGWIYSSLPVGVDAEDEAVVIRRLRQVVSPAGDLRESEHVVHLETLTPEILEAEASEVGLAPAGRHDIAATDDHLGSVVVVLEAAR